MAKKYLDGINFDAPSKGFQGTLTIRDTEARGLIQDNANAIASLTAAEQADRRDINQNADDIDLLEARCVDIENKNDQQDDRLDAAERDIDSLTDRMVTAESDIDALEGRMDTAEDDIDHLENRMDAAENDIDNLEDRMDTAEGDIDALEGRMDTAEGDIDSLEGRMDTAEGDISDIKAKDEEQDAHLADLDDRVAASTYEAGIGIYFGQGVKHTNINVEDELIDQINQNTQNIQILFDTKTEIYTEDGQGNRVEHPELTIDDTLQIKTVGQEEVLRAGDFKLYGLTFSGGDLSTLALPASGTSAYNNMVAAILKYVKSWPDDTVGGHTLPGVQVIQQTTQGSAYYIKAPAMVTYDNGAGTVSMVVNDDRGQVGGGTEKDSIYSVSYSFTYNTTTNTGTVSGLKVRKGVAQDELVVYSKIFRNSNLTDWTMKGYDLPYWFEAMLYGVTLDENNDFYQTATVFACTASVTAPADGTVLSGANFTTNNANALVKMGKYGDIPVQLFIAFADSSASPSEVQRDTYRVIFDGMGRHEVQTIGASLPTLTQYTLNGKFIDKDSNEWAVTWDTSTMTGTISAVGSAGGLTVTSNVLSFS